MEESVLPCCPPATHTGSNYHLLVISWQKYVFKNDLIGSTYLFSPKWNRYTFQRQQKSVNICTTKTEQRQPKPKLKHYFPNFSYWLSQHTNRNCTEEQHVLETLPGTIASRLGASSTDWGGYRATAKFPRIPGNGELEGRWTAGQQSIREASRCNCRGRNGGSAAS